MYGDDDSGDDLRLLADDPLGDDGGRDLLGRRPFAAQVAALLDRVRSQSQSSVMALTGPWGAGKSSVLDMLETQLREHAAQRWLITRFTPWVYSDLEAMQLGFLAELLQVLPEADRWSQTRAKVGGFVKKLAPLGAAGQLAGADASGVASFLADMLSGDTSADAVRGRAAGALENQDNAVLVIMDDLDRLEAPELLLVLKLVRLIGRLPNVYYLLSYDEETLYDVLQHTSLVGKSRARAHDYLEKLVQVRLDLPGLRPYHRDALVDAAFQTLLRSHPDVVSAEQLPRLQRRLQEHLLPYLDSPRTIKRVFGQVDAFFASVSGEVDFTDFLCITWLRCERPSVHRLLQHRRDDALGQSSAFTQRNLAHRFSHQQPAESRWPGWLSSAGVGEGEIDSMISLLGDLFPAIRAETRRESLQDWFFEDVASRSGVGHRYFFDRYFSYGVPEDDLSESVVRQAIDDLANGRTSEVTDSLGAALSDEPIRTAWRVDRALPVPTSAVAPLLNYCAEAYARVGEDERSIVSGPAHSLERLTRHLLQGVDAAGVAQEITDLSQTPAGMTLVEQFVAWEVRAATAGERGTTPPEVAWRQAVTRAASDALQIKFARLAIMAISEVQAADVASWWSWRQFDKSAAMNWLKAQVDSGTWDLFFTLSRWVTHAISSSHGQVAHELELHFVDQVFGLSDVVQRLQEELLQPLPDVDWDHLPDTTSNRGLVVRRDLHQWSTHRDQPNVPQRPQGL